MDAHINWDSLSRQELIDLLIADGKSVVAMDGAWFQAIEREQGMDTAVHYDEQAWDIFTRSEAVRIKKVLGLGEHPGLEGLARALAYRMADRSHPTEILLEEDRLVYRITECRVQAARKRKGMPFHPCKSVAMIEYGGFGEAVDSRISCRCLSCFPDITDPSCSCAWEYTLRGQTEDGAE